MMLYYKNILLLLGPEIIVTPLAIKYATQWYGSVLVLLAVLISFFTVYLFYRINLQAQFDSIYEIAWRFGGNSLRTFTKVIQMVYNIVQIAVYITLISAFLEFLLNNARGDQVHGVWWTSNATLKVGIHFVVFVFSVLSSFPLLTKLLVHSRLMTLFCYIALLVSAVGHLSYFNTMEEHDAIKTELARKYFSVGDGVSIFPFFICIFATHNNLSLISPSIDASNKVKFSALISALFTIGIYAIIYGNVVYSTLYGQTHAIPMLFYPPEFYDSNNALFAIDAIVASLFIAAFILAIPSQFTFIHDMIDEQYFSEWQPSVLRHSIICFIFTSFSGLLASLFWMDDILIEFNGVCGVILIYFLPGVICLVYGEKSKWLVVGSVIVILLGVMFFAIGVVYFFLSLVLDVSDTIASAFN
ncbi:hypothetical protein EIN_092080 [Entamoeba invadens IP1]|uniref:Amino acid transporter transmembrane domain-containing protein n=1 Tax=Entamoeba invadens IP1 TaxID=370355 RepID=A0A0A1TYT7_ENTIV|nr:hypothetical protein EIN_092080 [Entamoeba invadens IP1]ELP86643.1 hypothetical protein EIN_092080 [Entamoeba invadens IP1]|eukprot:XP_004185989.1 hypothetical protein EIN_092080 [Entamoeba invadens IP1]